MLTLLPVLLLGCAPAPAPEETAPPADSPAAAPPAACATAPAVTWDNWGRGFFRTWCGACHSATAQERNGAPEAVDLETVAQVRALRSSIHRSVLEDHTMPLGGGIPEEDLQLLEVFLSCELAR